ncbi:YigZ family protein [Companilactobacillus metriopterae]|uniref:YigZ family protein n=1 Tax=Companilactobacillus metriopterae TaxID=1909267 RepID=UPI00100AE19B|nr:YigZ family protein [Companilactobacillus metriopterae]
MPNYLTIKEPFAFEQEIKKSKFIAHLAPTNSEQEAKEFIEKIKLQEKNATHNCSAYVVLENIEIERMSDDGEPSGTAGAPILNVIQQNNLKNISVVVTRYFGGIKLGAGGLIRAYSSSTSKAIDEIPIFENRIQQGFNLNIPYSLFDKFENFSKKENINLLNKAFSENVNLDIFLDLENCDEIIANINNEFQGKIDIIKTNTEELLVPIKK